MYVSLVISVLPSPILHYSQCLQTVVSGVSPGVRLFGQFLGSTYSRQSAVPIAPTIRYVSMPFLSDHKFILINLHLFFYSVMVLEGL